MNINVFIEHFRKLGNSSDVCNQEAWVLNDHNIQGNESLNNSFTDEEIGKVVDSLKKVNLQVVIM